MLSVKQDLFYNMIRTSKMEALFQEKMRLSKKVDYQEECCFLLRRINFELFFNERTT